MRMSLILTLAVGLTATAVTAKPPLRDVPVVDDGLLAVGIADEIRNTCDDIEARMLTALMRLQSLKSEARALGYSAEEIEDYVTSKAEKARMRARGEAYLKANGVTLGDKSGYCRLGKQEIAKGSAIGTLLKAR
ncbi:DUF5333 domain-containing protein [Puniceibacterium sediminis]|uniref:DUF5333 domain-containing protein n=1 Tax=Puniceibacterium sediminis TaxID=1608407 RepID=A0A238W9U3_9RHOB|nr:DUF5333 domain-containing protein [Puniceibacterium sediminis]SNR42479.1 hypothetical protein SAMN06265370_104229 [Puniceibacterium sediminis]